MGATTHKSHHTLEAPTVLSTDYENIFTQDLPILQSTIRKKYYSVPIPINTYLEEAEGIYEVLSRKLVEMENGGFNTENAELYYRRIASARTAQVAMILHASEKKLSQKYFKKLYSEALTLREHILARFKMVVAQQPHHAILIEGISKHKRIGDTIQDLFELGKAGEHVIEELKKMKVTAADLSRAKELGTTLGRIHSAAQLDNQTHSEPRIIRDKAFTLLYESLHEIREWAKIIYKYNPPVRKLFFSKYLRDKEHRLKKAAQMPLEGSKAVTINQSYREPTVQVPPYSPIPPVAFAKHTTIFYPLYRMRAPIYSPP
ncbi:MAG: hypothetical protein OCD76_10455 [Reichenbachiella sp.]